jgi:hypothetical protein
MKKQFLYIFVFFAFISCTDEVKFNNPSFEAQKDNVFWRAIDFKASFTDNYADNISGLKIVAYTRNESLTLTTVASTPQTYFLGTSDSSTATYVLTDATGTVTFATGTGIGEGQIVITEYDAVNRTVTGTFKFNAENIYNNPLAGPVLNFQYGHFYKIPVIGSDTSLVSYPAIP